MSLLMPWLRCVVSVHKVCTGQARQPRSIVLLFWCHPPLTLPHVPPLQHYSQPPRVTLIMLLRRLLTCEICHHEPCCRSLATTDSSQSSSASATMHEPLTGFDEKREVLLGAAARAFAHDRALARGAAHRAACVASTRPPFTSADLSAISGQARWMNGAPQPTRVSRQSFFQIIIKGQKTPQKTSGLRMRDKF